MQEVKTTVWLWQVQCLLCYWNSSVCFLWSGSCYRPTNTQNQTEPWRLISHISCFSFQKNREQHILLKIEELWADEEDWLVFTAALRTFSSNFFRPLSADIMSEREHKPQLLQMSRSHWMFSTQRPHQSSPLNMGNSKMKTYFIWKFKNSGYL